MSVDASECVGESKVHEVRERVPRHGGERERERAAVLRGRAPARGEARAGDPWPGRGPRVLRSRAAVFENAIASVQTAL